MEGQSKKETILEVFTNVVIGYAWALMTQLIVFPIVGIETTFNTNIVIGIFFTISSIIRSYIVRRYYNMRQVKRALRGRDVAHN